MYHAAAVRQSRDQNPSANGVPLWTETACRFPPKPPAGLNRNRLSETPKFAGEANQTANVAPGNTVTLGQLLERSGAAGGKLLKPRAPPRNRLAEGWITSRAAVLLR